MEWRRAVFDAKRVLAIGAHTDDVELGCGGLLSRLKRMGASVHVIAFSRAEDSLPEGAPVDLLEREYRASMDVLGADSVHMGNIPVRNFDQYRQEVLDRFIELRKRVSPDLVLTFNRVDTHQDHEVIHAESVRAFRGISVLGYELPWNQASAPHDLFVEITEDDLAAKLRMLACYRSQVQMSRRYMDPEVIRALALVRGMQARMPLAEMFEVISMNWRQ
jgi:LmbE family N-acetylglucosaminyl deacetylase